MLISDAKKFIFVHNYKVAGSSVTKALAPYADHTRRANSVETLLIKTGMLPKHYPARYPWHITAQELSARLNGAFGQYFTFGFSRNPWDWQVSLYTFMLNNPAHRQHRLIRGMKSFAEYIDWRINREKELQKKAFYSDDDRCLMDFIGKIENIRADFAYICQKIGVKAEIPHVNKSRKNNEYLQYYDSRLIDYVYEAFYPDVVAFGYEKPVIGV